MRKDNMVFRGSIYMCDLGVGKGSEQSGTRPCLIIQNDTGNKFSKTTIVLALTKQDKCLPTHYPLKKENYAFLNYDSVSLAEQIRTVDKCRIREFIGRISKEDMEKIEEKIRISLDLQ